MSNQRISPLGWLGMALVVAIGLLVVFGALSMSTYGGYYGMMGSGWMGGISWMWIPALLTLGLGILLGWVLFGKRGAPVKAEPPTPTPRP